MSAPIERGAASIVITLADGNITVTHGEDGNVLADLQDAPEGTWHRLWEALTALEIT